MPPSRPIEGGSIFLQPLGYCRAMRRVFLFSGMTICVFAAGFWYFVSGLACGLSGAGGCSNIPTWPWKYPSALAYSLPVFALGAIVIFVSRWVR
ncbi:hypothetical protein AGR6A_pb0019 [Agrobacterium sp. NCPPB 925]|nr:hypothetical protein AGR6A_pb0019 [Agrobacterium sp. NCPPB 925]